MRRLACLICLCLPLLGCPEPPAPVEVEEPVTPAAEDPPAETPVEFTPPEEAQPNQPEPLQPAPGTIQLMAGSQDPVCNMNVDITGNPPSVVYGDETFVFCSKYCAEEFEANPKTYTREKTDLPPPAREPAPEEGKE